MDSTWDLLSAKLAALDARLALIDQRQSETNHLLSDLLHRRENSPEEDGPVPPDCFRLHGKVYGGFSATQWRLLKCLWTQPAVPIIEAEDYVYGRDHQKGPDAVRSLKRRLDRRLAQMGCPASISEKNGYLRLDVEGR